MKNTNSGLFDGTAGAVIDKLEADLKEEKSRADYWQKSADYWQKKYDESLHKQIELEKAIENLRAEAAALKGQLDEEIRMNQLPYGFAEQAAHEVALEALKRKWKDGIFSVDNDVASTGYYIASFRYFKKKIEKELTPNEKQARTNERSTGFCQ